MRSNDFSTDTLFEMDWHERSPAVPTLRQNPGRWVHFSQVEKLGINPMSDWDHPKGVYFYPTDWLLEPANRIQTGDQFATNYPYYFLADIDLSGPGMICSKITHEDVEALATRNVWLERLQEPHHAPMDGQSPALRLWSTIKRLVEEKKITWNKALSGLN